MEAWTKPEVSEIRMSAEIGGYQPDEDPERDPDPYLAPSADTAGDLDVE